MTNFVGQVSNQDTISPRRFPQESKAEVVSVKTVTRDPDTGELHVHYHVKHSNSIINSCLISFYRSNGTVEVILLL